MFSPQWSVWADKSSHQRQSRESWEHTTDAQLPERTDHANTVQGTATQRAYIPNQDADKCDFNMWKNTLTIIGLYETIKVK